MNIIMEPEMRHTLAVWMGFGAMLFLWGNMLLFAVQIIRETHKQKTDKTS